MARVLVVTGKPRPGSRGLDGGPLPVEEARRGRLHRTDPHGPPDRQAEVRYNEKRTHRHRQPLTTATSP
jgi:hypothetical protein